MSIFAFNKTKCWKEKYRELGWEKRWGRGSVGVEREKDGE